MREERAESERRKNKKDYGSRSDRESPTLRGLLPIRLYHRRIAWYKQTNILTNMKPKTYAD